MNPIFGQRIYDIYCFSGEELSAEEDNNADNATDISSHLAKEVFCYSGEETEDKDRNEQDNNQDRDISSIFENYKYCYSGEETENQGRTEHSSASMGSYLIGSSENAEENTFSHNNPTSSINDNNGFNVDNDDDMTRVDEEISSGNQRRTDFSSASRDSHLISSSENAEENTFSHNLTSSINDNNGFNFDDDDDMTRMDEEISSGNQGRTDLSFASRDSYLIGSSANADKNTFSHNNPTSSINNSGLNADDDNDMTRVDGETLSSQSPANQTSKKRDNSSLKKSSKRRVVRWTEELDTELLKAVELYGQNWSFIASLIKDRTTRQCRERWLNHFNPKISKEPWSLQEDTLVTEERRKKQDWHEISKKIEELFNRYRTPDSIKNRWNSKFKKYESKLAANQQASRITTNNNTRPSADGISSWLVNFPRSPQDSLQDNFG